MDRKFRFTTPSDNVQRARLAMARAEQRLARDVEPLEPCPDLAGIGIAFLTLEGLHPAYPPLQDIGISADPHADIAEAVRLLGEAMTQADTAADKIRYALTIRDLCDLDLFLPPEPEGRGTGPGARDAGRRLRAVDDTGVSGTGVSGTGAGRDHLG